MKTICIFCDFENDPDFINSDTKVPIELQIKNRVIYKDPNGEYYVLFPLEPAMFGHLLVILKKPSGSSKHITDITDSNLHPKLLSRFIKGVQFVAHTLKRVLSENGYNVERIYVISQCESVEHFHFHLKPRYITDTLRGDRFLLEKECEEALWTESPRKARKRMQQIQGIYHKYLGLIEISEWKRDTSTRLRWLSQIKSLLERSFHEKTM